MSKERANLFLYPLLEVHFPLGRVDERVCECVCLREATSACHPQGQPHPLQRDLSLGSGARLTFGNYF